MPIETYISKLNHQTREQVLPILLYLEQCYTDASFDEKYAEKSNIPTWRLRGQYVAIGCRKQYISVYFSSTEAVEAVRERADSPYVVARKGCVNISYRIKEMPHEAIRRGIDLCFSR